MEVTHFSPLNVVILKQTIAPKRYTLGIDDEEFSQRKPDKGLITKKEIRVLSLQAMHFNGIALFGILAHVRDPWLLRQVSLLLRDKFLL